MVVQWLLDGVGFAVRIYAAGMVLMILTVITLGIMKAFGIPYTDDEDEDEQESE